MLFHSEMHSFPLCIAEKAFQGIIWGFFYQMSLCARMLHIDPSGECRLQFLFGLATHIKPHGTVT